jgi:general secretion pathway protein B
VSYILDALRRADRDRQQQELRAPTLHIDGMPTPSLPTRHARVALPAVAIATVIVIAAWWVSQRAPEAPQGTQVTTPPAPATRQVPAAPPVSVTGAAVAPTLAAPTEAVTAPASTPPAPGPSATAASPSSPAVTVRPRTGLVVDAVAVPTLRTGSPAPPGPDVIAQETAARQVAPVSPSAESPPAWRDLPAEERRTLPHPELDVHAYADAPERRFVMIGLRRYREGEALPDGLVIDEITPDGIVVEHSGRRYTLPRR